MTFDGVLAVVADSGNEVVIIVNIFEKLCQELGPEVNHTKSGILAKGIKYTTLYMRKSSIMNIPLVRRYKFLEVMLKGKVIIDACLMKSRKYLQMAIC